MSDRFFTQTRCDRCRGELSIRTTSWFTDETICGDCSSKEKEIKAKLDDSSIYEGCGYVPDVV